MAYDSRPDTQKHAARVCELMSPVIAELTRRAGEHDASKMEPPELEAYDALTPRLKDLEYGSEEYRAGLREMKPAIRHHYAANRHHPEHFPDGIAGMTLTDLIEMLADWRAATERGKDGSMRKSLEIQRGRFAIGDQLWQVLANTADHYGWTDT